MQTVSQNQEPPLGGSFLTHEQQMANLDRVIAQDEDGVGHLSDIHLVATSQGAVASPQPVS